MNDQEEDEEYREARKRVRSRLKFFRDLTTYVVVLTGLFIVDWLTGGDWWVYWVAGVWGAFLVLDFLNVFVLSTLWGHETEERMVRRELHRHRGA